MSSGAYLASLKELTGTILGRGHRATEGTRATWSAFSGNSVMPFLLYWLLHSGAFARGPLTFSGDSAYILITFAKTT